MASRSIAFFMKGVHSVVSVALNFQPKLAREHVFHLDEYLDKMRNALDQWSRHLLAASGNKHLLEW